jgi:hypothetical protein
MNDIERERWVLNDEGLYCWHMRSHKGMRSFLRENRTELDAYIFSRRSGLKGLRK